MLYKSKHGLALIHDKVTQWRDMLTAECSTINIKIQLSSYEAIRIAISGGSHQAIAE
jgi:hypothetical protein